MQPDRNGSSAAPERERKPKRGRRRWTLLVFALVVGFTVWHAGAMATYLARVSAEQFVSTSEPLPRQQIPLGTAFDAQTWIRLSDELASAEDWRLRTAVSENAPEGRPVYWNSGWAWWLISGGRLWSSLAGVPFAAGLEQAAVWVNLPVLIMVALGLGIWMKCRWGWGGAAVLVSVMVGDRGFYEGFYPGNPDHHGLITGCAAGMFMGIVLAGAGWHRGGIKRDSEVDFWWPENENAVRRSMCLSAVAGAVGLWFSAASLIPVFATMSLGLLVSGVPRGRGQSLWFSAGAWRWWGRVGASLSLGFYLLEQFPDRLGWQLEANHPLYALAWLGGAELLAWWLESRAKGWERPNVKQAAGLVLSGLAVLSPGLVVVWKGVDAFALLDPFLEFVHSHVTELESLPHRVATLGVFHYASYMVLQPICLMLAAGLAWRLRETSESFLLRCAWWGVVGLVSLGWWQNRWMLMVGGPLAVVVALSWGLLIPRIVHRRGRMFCVILVVALAGWHPWQLVKERWAVRHQRDVQSGEARQLLYREVARVLRKDAAGQEVLLLAAPDVSTAVSYFGDFSNLGTFYWENRPGLARAAQLLSASDETEAGVVARRWGVTHVALFGHDGGGQMYCPEGTGLGPSLLAGRVDPVWLRPIVYVPPPPFSRIESRVRLYATDFTQTPAEAFYRHGLAAMAYGEKKHALHCFTKATTEAPEAPAPWFRLAELQLEGAHYVSALRSIVRGVELLPTEQREVAYLEAAKLFASRGATEEGDQLLDRAMASADSN